MRKIPVFLILFALGFVLFNVFDKSKNIQPLPQQYLDDRSNFGKVNQLFTDAMDLTTPPDRSGKPFDMPNGQQEKILTNLKEGVALSNQIDDSFLDYLNPELKDYYRNKYVKGNELFYEGLTEDTSNINSIGVKKQLEGNNLIGEWIKWWDLNKEAITNKAFK